MPFDAATAVEPMDFDFSKYAVDDKGKVLPGAKGTVPEPSQEEFRAYSRGLTKLGIAFRAVEKKSETHDEDGKRVREDLTEDEINALSDEVQVLGDQVDTLVATLSKDQPSKDLMAKLPFRVKNKFAKWLQEEFAPKA